MSTSLGFAVRIGNIESDRYAPQRPLFTLFVGKEMERVRNQPQEFGHVRHLAVFVIALFAASLLGLISFAGAGNTSHASQAPSVAAGPSGLSTLGDTVWHDTNLDGLQAPGEQGIDGVLVSLYRDNNDAVFDPVADTLLAQEFTGDDPTTLGIEHGWYDFQIFETDALYWVVVGAGNFTPGGVLTGYVHTRPAQFGPNLMLVYLPDSQDYNDADFGYARTAIKLVKVAGDTPDGGDARYLRARPGPLHLHGDQYRRYVSGGYLHNR